MEESMRREARGISQRNGTGYQASLDEVARSRGHSHWGSLLAAIRGGVRIREHDGRPQVVVGCRLDDRKPTPEDFARVRDALDSGSAEARHETEWNQIWIRIDGDVVQLHHDEARGPAMESEVARRIARDAMDLLATGCDWQTKADDPPIDEVDRARYGLMAAMCRAHGLEDVDLLNLMSASPFETYRLHNGHGDLGVSFTPQAIAALDAVSARSISVRWVNNRLHVSWYRGYDFDNADPADPLAALERAGLVGVDCIVGDAVIRHHHEERRDPTITRVPPVSPRGSVVHYDRIPGAPARLWRDQTRIGSYDASGRRITDAKVVHRNVALVSRTASAREIDRMETIVDLLDPRLRTMLEEVRTDSLHGDRYEFTYLLAPVGAMAAIRSALTTLGANAATIRIRDRDGLADVWSAEGRT